MPLIRLETSIEAPVAIVFDLARSIDLHKISTADTKEEAVAGRTSGLIEMGETVTWRAVHFGITQHLTSQITEFEQPDYFADEMVRGVFSSFKHEHIFSEKNGITTMSDVFNYKSPLGIAGKLFDYLLLKNYMTALITERNRIIKKYAEDKSLYSQVLL